MRMDSPLRKARVKLGLSLTELSSRTGIASGTICCIELRRQRMTIEQAEMLANSLGANPVDFVQHHCGAERAELYEWRHGIRMHDTPHLRARG